MHSALVKIRILITSPKLKAIAGTCTVSAAENFIITNYVGNFERHHACNIQLHLGGN